MGDEDKVILTLEADDDASQKIDNVTKSLQNLDKQSGNMGKTNSGWATNLAKGYEKAVDNVNSMTRQYNNIMSGFNRTVKNIVMDMGSAIYDFTSDSIKNFTEFSEQHAKTLGAMSADYDNTAQSQAKFFRDASKLKEQAMQLGTYGVTGQGALMNVTEVSTAQTELIKAGVSAEEITAPNSNITRDVLTFAQANDLSTDSAVEFAVSLGNQFGIDKSEWGSMLDKVSHTADMSIIDVQDIITSMKWAGGITSGLDRDMEETLGMISILGDFGLRGSQAGTGVQALMTRLLTGDTTVITAAQAEVAPGKALEKFYEFSKIAKPDGNLLPMSEVIEEMDSAMADMTDEEQAWFAKKLFGLYQMKSAYALLNGDDTDLNAVIDEIRNQSDGTNEDKLSQLLDSQYGQLTSLDNMIEGIKFDLGDRLSPFVNAIRDELFNFLGNSGNYNINFNNLQSALDESCDLIEEKYGTAIADAVRGLGDTAIDLTQIGAEVAPIFGEGLVKIFSSLFEGDIFSSNGVTANWSEMINDMSMAVDDLPEDLQGLGDAIVGAIDWFGKLTAVNAVSNVAELVSSLLQILNIAGGAVIKVAGGVVVSGATVTTSGGSSYTQWGAGAGAGATGKSMVGTADDVAKALGTTTDEVVATFGKQSLYSVDDIAKGLGTTVDDVISNLGIVSKGASTISKLGKGLGILGIGLEVAGTGMDAYEAFSAGDNKGGVEAIGGGLGSIGGGLGLAKLGAAIGSAIAPGPGTIIGGILGAIGGSIFGDKAGEWISGSVYDAVTPGEETDAYARLTSKGREYNRHLQELQKSYDNLVSAGKGDTVEAYDIKNQIDDLNRALSDMGDTTIAGLIEKSSNLRDIINDIADVQNQSDAETDTIAEQAKSYIASLASLPEVKDDNQKQLAQGMIDKLNSTYNMGLEMDESGKYNMTTNEMWDVINNSVTQSKADSNMEALLGYLTQYQSAQARVDDAIKTRNSAWSDYEYAKENIFPEEHPFLAWSGLADGNEGKWAGTTKERYEEWEAADEAANTAIQEFNALDEAIRQCYKDMGYSASEVDKMMSDLASTSETATTDERRKVDSNFITYSQMKREIDEFINNTAGPMLPLNPLTSAILQNSGINNSNMFATNDNIEISPRFTVAAPVVNVDVNVDQSGKVTKNVSILNHGQGAVMDNWYSRTSAQYGQTSK